MNAYFILKVISEFFLRIRKQTLARKRIKWLVFYGYYHHTLTGKMVLKIEPNSKANLCLLPNSSYRPSLNAHSMYLPQREE